LSSWAGVARPRSRFPRMAVSSVRCLPSLQSRALPLRVKLPPFSQGRFFTSKVEIHAHDDSRNNVFAAGPEGHSAPPHVDQPLAHFHRDQEQQWRKLSLGQAPTRVGEDEEVVRRRLRHHARGRGWMEAAEFLNAFEAQGGFELLSGDDLRAMDRLLRCDDMFLLRLVASRADVPEELDTPALTALQRFFKSSSAEGLGHDGRRALGETRMPRGTFRSPSKPSGVAVRRIGGAAIFRGPVQDHIETKLLAAVKPVHLEVHNESHGQAADESHFHVLVVADAFEGLRPLQRHRLINGLFTQEDGDLKFHSLRITAKTPAQWAASDQVPPAPKCSGKGDGRTPTDASKL